MDARKRLTILTSRTSVVGRALAFLVTDAITAVQTRRIAHGPAIRNGGPFDFSRRPSTVFAEHVGHRRRIRELVSICAADRARAAYTTNILLCGIYAIIRQGK